MPFCSVPFIHSFIDTKGENRICCTARWVPGQYDLQDWEGEDYQKIREAVSSDDKDWYQHVTNVKEEKRLVRKIHIERFTIDYMKDQVNLRLTLKLEICLKRQYHMI